MTSTASLETPPAGVGRRALIRPAIAAGVLVAEYLLVSMRFDARALHGREGVLHVMGYLGDAASVALLAFVAALILRGDALRQDMREALGRHPPRRGTALHIPGNLIAFALFLWVTERIFGGASGEFVSAWWLVAWVLLGLSVVVSLLLFCLSAAALRTLLPRLGPPLLVGVTAGLAVWGFGWASAQLWPYMAGFVLSAVAGVLSLFTSHVAVDPAAHVIGTGDFAVHVAPVCSGLEGVGLILALLGGYMVLYRRELRFPHVLVMLPLGVLVVWLANLGRVAALIGIGAHVSTAVALGGFHSKAGWVLFCLVALGCVAVIRATPALSHGARAGTHHEIDEIASPAPYLVPLMAWIAVGMLTGLFAATIDVGYPLRLVAGAFVLWVYRKHYAEHLTLPGWEALLIGGAVFALWLWLVPAHTEAGDGLRAEVLSLGTVGTPLWLGARVVGASLVVPIVEELAFRGYLMRRLIARDFGRVSPGARSLWAVLASSLAFGLLHAEWVAGSLAGLAFAVAQLRHGRLIDAIASHAVANGCIAVYVVAFDGWGLWA